MKKIIAVVSAKIEVSPFPKGIRLSIYDAKGQKFEHDFNQRSRVYKEFISINFEEFQHRYVGATFVFAQQENSFSGYTLVDFRPAQFKGFIHSEDMMNTFADKIGIELFSKAETKERNLFSNIGNIDTLFARSNRNHLGAKFTGQTSKFNFGMDSTNEFEGQLSFAWNPFAENISTVVKVTRLICENGMIGTSPLLNSSFRIVNDVENNLKIAKSYIGDNLKMLLQEKVEKMSNTVSSVYFANTVKKHANARIQSGNNKEFDANKRLELIAYASDVKIHCKHINENIIYSELAHKYPSHLTLFDVWNMLTEMDTYTAESSTSTSKNVQMDINRVMFEQTNNSNHSIRVRSDVGAEHNTAFWGSSDRGY